MQLESPSVTRFFERLLTGTIPVCEEGVGVEPKHLLYHCLRRQFYLSGNCDHFCLLEVSKPCR